MKFAFCLVVIWLTFVSRSFASNDSTLEKISNFPDRLFAKLNRRAATMQDQLASQTEKYLQKMARQEQKMQQKLAKTDSNAAKNLFAGAQQKYAFYIAQLKSPATSSPGSLHGEYLANVDSTNCALSFLQQHAGVVSGSGKIQGEIGAASQQFGQLQSKFQQTDEIKEFIRQRQQLLKDNLSRYAQSLGLNKYLTGYNQQLYYYSEQLREYKQALNDPDKMMEKALIVLNKIPAFNSFMKAHGQLASLFGISANYGSAEGVVGLQTRDQVQSLLQGQIGGSGSAGMASFTSGLSSAHQQLDQFKDKIGQLGGGSGDMAAPDFKPNPEKTHSFLKRIEVGTNLQTTRTNYYFPTTTDIGLSLGYKLSSRATVGVGGSYKVGWGSGINHVAITSQGVSIRSFVDVKIKGTMFITGGLEYNYQQPFSRFQNIQSLSTWQQSGLIGITKLVAARGKIIKKTKLQLLWDFLSYSQQPRTQAFKFRVGYNF